MKAIAAYISPLILALFVSGCSAIGMSIGDAEDNKHPPSINRPIKDINLTDTGAKVMINMLSGDLLEGKYAGLGQMSQSDYESIFHSLIDRSTETGGFPAPGDTIFIYDNSGNELSFILNGYNSGYLSACRFGEEEPIAILTRNISNMLLGYGEIISGDNLEIMIENGKLPTYKTVILDITGGQRIIPADSIISVIEFDKNNRMWKGLAIGAIIDIAALTLFIHALTHMHWAG